MRIPYRDQAAGQGDKQAIRSLQPPQSGGHRFGLGQGGMFEQRLIDRIGDHLGVGRGMEDRPPCFKSVAEFPCAHQVTVVRHRHAAPSPSEQERLDVFDGVIPRRRVPHVAQGDFAVAQFVQPRRGEHVSHQPAAAVEAEPVPSAHGDPAAFLSAVLQGIQSVIYLLRGCPAIRVENPENPAFFTYLSHSAVLPFA